MHDGRYILKSEKAAFNQSTSCHFARKIKWEKMGKKNRFPLLKNSSHSFLIGAHVFALQKKEAA
ncbi:hypothetical protein BpJC7_30080 [Weizmannia acidilactici]|uniref:Uncharacterized protein n=1 Tax=Weizmannia acidilactici TaxID=2607726 RepID=A0A5J4JM03_9BACI|nr:hypothetical protein BpJC7_30080 [Weizmannia acidilactici]